MTTNSTPQEASRHLYTLSRRIIHEGFPDIFGESENDQFTRMTTSGTYAALAGTIVECSFATNAATKRAADGSGFDLRATPLTLPFSDMFMEGNVPNENGTRLGIACSQFDRRNASESERHNIETLARSGGLPIPFDRLEESRWLWTAMPLFSSPGKPLLPPAMQIRAALDAEGKLIDTFHVSFSPALASLGQQDAMQNIATSTMAVVKEAVDLLTSADTPKSTIATRDHSIPKKTVKYLSHRTTRRTDGIRFKTIIVRGIRSGQPDIELVPNEQGKMPEHTARGTWAKYGIDGRGLLFGQLRGLIWKPPHQKGHRKNGKVIADYKLAGEAA